MSSSEKPVKPGGNRIPASYLKRFLPSQGSKQRDGMSHDLRVFLDNMQ